MPDITLPQLIEAVPAGTPARNYLENLPALPPGMSVSALFESLLTAASVAQDAANESLPPNQRINGYIAPRYTSTQYDGKGALVIRGVASIDFVKVVPAGGTLTSPVIG